MNAYILIGGVDDKGHRSHGWLWNRKGEVVFSEPIYWTEGFPEIDVYDTDFARIGVHICGDLYTGEIASLTIGDHEGMTFGPFDASVVGEAYAGATDEIKQAILNTLRSTYADYDVTFLMSDETVEPAEPHATIHFGHDDEALLGLADNVDGYNADSGQNAIVFVEHFAAYWTMKLDPQQMGQMIGNSASHELGHLLGLHHTHQADSVMDIAAGDAWDVAGERGFRVADLDPEVFPVGQLNSPRILADTAGLRAD